MGITISSKNLEVEIGAGGFARFRAKVADLSNEEFGKHYEKLNEGTYLFGGEREEFFEEYDAKTIELVEKKS